MYVYTRVNIGMYVFNKQAHISVDSIYIYSYSHMLKYSISRFMYTVYIYTQYRMVGHRR